MKLPDVEGEWEWDSSEVGEPSNITTNWNGTMYRTYRKVMPKIPMSRMEAILWMMADEENILEVDEYSNKKLYFRWGKDHFESRHEGEYNWKINAHHLPFLCEATHPAFRAFRPRIKK